MVAAMEEISRDSAATNEQVLELEHDIEGTREAVAQSLLVLEESADASAEAAAELTRLDSEAAQATSLADSARESQESVQGKLDELASATYRGVVVDPLTNAANSGDPQAMIDRAAYMGVLAEGTNTELNRLKEANRGAAEQATRANAAVAEAGWIRSELRQSERLAQKTHDELERHQGELERQHSELEARQAELQMKVSEVQARVDALDPTARSRWQSKDNPLDPNLSGIGAEGAVAAALGKLGSPYAWGAAGPDAFDCSGLMFWSYQQEGKMIPRTSQAQLAGGTPVSRSELQPGDIVGYYPGVTHVGMYIGNGQVVHASDYGIPVQVVAVDSMPFQGAARY